MKDQFLILRQIVDEFWNDKKELDYTHPSHGGKKKIIKKLQKHIIEIRNLKLEEELQLLAELHGIEAK